MYIKTYILPSFILAIFSKPAYVLLPDYIQITFMWAPHRTFSPQLTKTFHRLASGYWHMAMKCLI